MSQRHCPQTQKIRIFTTTTVVVAIHTTTNLEMSGIPGSLRKFKLFFFSYLSVHLIRLISAMFSGGLPPKISSNLPAILQKPKRSTPKNSAALKKYENSHFSPVVEFAYALLI